jgi:glutaredoxin-like protein NrdH
MSNVTVYSLPACVQCESTKRYLKKNGVEFEEIDLAEDAASMEYVKSLGYSSAPVVVAGDENWSGFRMDKLAQIVA